MSESRFTNITGCILAGGGSTRMQSDKALLSIGGEPCISRISRTLQSVFEQVIVIADDHQRYAFLGLPVHEDLYKHCGPLAGIHSGLVHASTESIFVLSCDLPLVGASLVRSLVAASATTDVTVASLSENNIQPLCGVYRKSALPHIEYCLTTGEYSVRRMIRGLDVRYLYSNAPGGQIMEQALLNMNTPEEYRQVCRISEAEKFA